MSKASLDISITNYPPLLQKTYGCNRSCFVIIVIITRSFPLVMIYMIRSGFTANYFVGSSIARKIYPRRNHVYTITMTIFNGLSENTPIIII